MDVLYEGSKQIKELALSKACSLLEVTSKAELEYHPDFILLGCTEKTSLEELAPIVTKGRQFPSVAKQSVVLLFNIDMLKNSGQDKLLKIIEDNKYVSIIATNSGVGEVLPTIRSRMQIITDRTKSEISDTVEAAAISNLDITLSEDVLSELKKVISSIDSNTPLAKALHLIKEKDPLNFYTSYGDKTTLFCLFNLIGNVVNAYIANHSKVMLKDNVSSLTGSYSLDALDKATYVIEAALNKVKAIQYVYTEKAFFTDISTLDRLLQHGKEGLYEDRP